jgi:hypothetical protein
MTETAVIAQIKGPAMALPAVQPDEGSAILSMIERAARDPAVDLDKMERLFAMHERIEQRRAETAFNAAMASAQAEIGPVVKNVRNTHTNSKYADLDAVYDVVQPIVTKHGFGKSFGTGHSERGDGFVKMVCDVTHTGGFCKRYESDIPIDAAGSQGKVNKTPIQAFGSTTTYGRRYQTLLIFDVVTMDDNDGNRPKARKSSSAAKKDGTDIVFNEIKTEFETAVSLDHLQHIKESRWEEVEAMPSRWFELLENTYSDKFDELKAAEKRGAQ